MSSEVIRTADVVQFALKIAFYFCYLIREEKDDKRTSTYHENNK